MMTRVSTRDFDSAPEFCAPAASAIARGPRSSRDLATSLMRALGAEADRRTAVRALVRIVGNFLPSSQVFYFERDELDELRAAAQAGDAARWPQVTDDLLLATAEAACRQGRAKVFGISDAPELRLVAAPVAWDGQAPEALVAAVPPEAGSSEALIAMLQLVSAHVALWQSNSKLRKAEDEAQITAATQELLEKVERCDRVKDASRVLVNELRRYFHCETAALALRPEGSGRCRLLVVSGAKRFDRSAPLPRAIEAALDEAVVRDEITLWPPADGRARRAALAHHKLCSVADAQCVLSAPLRNPQGDAVGAWLFLASREAFEQSAAVTFLRAAERRVAASLLLLRRISARPGARLLRSMRQAWRLRKVQLALLGLCLVAAAMASPVRYRIGADCRLEPVRRRFVAAPYDGILEKVLVRPGDVIQQGDVLAGMDGREIRWELAGLRADRDSAAKRRDTALANHKFAAFEVARLEVERLELKMRLLEERLDNLQVRSPVAGIVTTGGLEDAEKAPVTCGQKLFEIAPLDKMTAEIAIPESELPYVARGMDVLVCLEGDPIKKRHGRIERIHPRAEIRDKQNVFVGELTLDNADQALRPGMQGRAKIVGRRHPLAWNLFHRAWDWLYLALGT